MLFQMGQLMPASGQDLVGNTTAEMSSFYIFENYTTTHSDLTILRMRNGLDYHHPDNWGFSTSIFSRAYFGSFLNKYPGYSFLRHNRYDWINLNHTWTDSSRSFILSRIDRAFLYFHKGDFEFRLGRQLIHWGQTLVWNVNDIFNTHSLLDADRPVKLGSDAARVIWYTGPESVLEFAAKLNRHQEVTAAVMGRFNHAGLEWQWQTGMVEQQDWMFGGGLTGNIRGMGIRSEFAYYLPLAESSRNHTLLASLGVDFVFANQVIWQGEILYNQLHDHIPQKPFSNLYATTASPKALSISQWSATMNMLYMVSKQFSLAMSSFYFHDYRALLVYPVVGYFPTSGLELALTIRLSKFQLDANNYNSNMFNIKVLYAI